MDQNQGKTNFQDREDLTGEHTFGDMGQLVLLFVFIVVWIVDSFLYHLTDIYSHFLPLYARIILACIVFAIAGHLARAGLKIVFGETRETPSVIRKGVFNKVRHPIYLGAILLYAGLLLLKLSLAAVGVWVIIILFYHFIALYEEKLLLQKFGDAYIEYKKEVPMWIPSPPFLRKDTLPKD